MTAPARARLGVFGGTFHPPHEGHAEAARLFLEKARLDFLFVIPSAVPPHKPLAEGATAEQRLEMARIAFLPLSPKIRVLDLELARGEVSYTVDTVRTLAHDFPEYELCLYVGSDSLLEFESWREFRTLLSLVTLCYAAREDDLASLDAHAQYLEKTYGARTEPLGVCRTLSSTRIRERLAAGARPAGLDRHVLSYIENHGLYRRKEP